LSRAGQSAESDEMPAVFDRLTNPKNFHATHRHRFTPDGKGRGREGREDDDRQQRAIAGQATITRDGTPELDSPHRARSAAAAASPASPAAPRPRAADTAALPDVFARLATPSKKRDEDEFERTQRVRKEFGVIREAVPKWQSGRA